MGSRPLTRNATPKILLLIQCVGNTTQWKCNSVALLLCEHEAMMGEREQALRFRIVGVGSYHIINLKRYIAYMMVYVECFATCMFTC